MSTLPLPEYLDITDVNNIKNLNEYTDAISAVHLNAVSLVANFELPFYFPIN